MLSRRWVIAGLVIGGMLLCGWCSLLSGIGGWFIGSDIAGREARVRFAATAEARPDLPPLGVLVTRLDRTGPAAQAGVVRGDVITAIDGITLQDARDLRDALNRLRVGVSVRLTLDDGIRTREVQALLASFPADPQRPYLGIYFTSRAEEPGDL
jgi:membrane-associated protease RseP (regulator of RpoE activity)